MNNLNEVGKIYLRPWGFYQTLLLGDGYQVKAITLNPSSALSLQKHEHRAEHWVIVKGAPLITVDDKTRVHQIGEKVFIDKNTPHRAENYNSEPAVIVEVQLGQYLGEDDIIRLADIYGRDGL